MAGNQRGTGTDRGGIRKGKGKGVGYGEDKETRGIGRVRKRGEGRYGKRTVQEQEVKASGIQAGRSPD